jgi:hypothetical protein
VIPQEQFLSQRQRYQPIALPQHFSDEQMARDGTLLAGDHQEIARYRQGSRVDMAIQIGAVRLSGRCVNHVHDVSPHLVHYLGQPLDLPPSLTVEVPARAATSLAHRQHGLTHLGFQRCDQRVQAQLAAWLAQQARRGTLPEALFPPAETHLVDQRVLLPGPSGLERLSMHVCSNGHVERCETVFRRLSPALRQAMDQLRLVPEGEPRSAFYHLKA